MKSYVLFIIGGQQKAIATTARSDKEICELAFQVGKNPKARSVEVYHFREGSLILLDKIIP